MANSLGMVVDSYCFS